MNELLKPDLTRRELVGALARWTVPSVVTITLGTRSLLAMVPSCPPCTKRTAGKCKACSVSQILNCQCEPCLGAPYCTGAGPGGTSSSSVGQTGISGGSPDRSERANRPDLPQLGTGYEDSRSYSERARVRGLRGYTSDDPLSAPLYRDPFATERRYRGLGTSPFDNGSLYGRLRGDSIVRGMRP